jgi:hypothetical protein
MPVLKGFSTRDMVYHNRMQSNNNTDASGVSSFTVTVYTNTVCNDCNLTTPARQICTLTQLRPKVNIVNV